MSLVLEKPSKGSPDWHGPLNDNFQRIMDYTKAIETEISEAKTAATNQSELDAINNSLKVSLANLVENTADHVAIRAELENKANKDGTLQEDLNADTIDGEHAEAFVHTTGGTVTGPLNISRKLFIGRLTQESSLESPCIELATNNEIIGSYNYTGIRLIAGMDPGWGSARLYMQISSTFTKFGPNVYKILYDGETYTPFADNAYDWGSATKRIKQYYGANSAISTSDQRLKTAIQSIKEDIARDFIMSLNPVTYEMIDNGKAPEERRAHWGLAAQEVEQALYSNGMNTLDFAGLIISPTTQEIETDEFTEESIIDDDGMEQIVRMPIMKTVITGERYGLRYEEFIAPLIKMVQVQQRKLDDMEKRLEVLESLSLAEK